METQIKTISDEALAAAADWWAKSIRQPHFDNGGTDRANVFAQVLAHMQVQRVTEEQLERFKKRLAELMRERSPLSSDYPDLCIATDYHPDPILCDAADAAGIPHGNFPLKTVMWINGKGEGHVVVRAGYSASEQTIFGDPIWTVYGVSHYLMEWAAGRRGREGLPKARDFAMQMNDCEVAISRLYDSFKFNGWPLPELSDSERVRSAEASREYADLELLGGIVNDQVKLATEQPSPETYLAAILAHQRLSDQLAAWVAASGVV